MKSLIFVSNASRLKSIFQLYSGGVKTNRDDWNYDFNRDALETKIKLFIDTYNSEVDRWRRRGSSNIIADDFVTYDDKRIKWSGDLKMHLEQGKDASYSQLYIRHSLYRPFVKKYLYFDSLLNNRRYLQHLFLPTYMTEIENIIISLSGLGSE